MTQDVQPVPERYGTVTPSLTVEGCAEALEFYREALDAEVLASMEGPGGKVWHAEMRIGDSVVMLNDEFPEQGHGGPRRLGGTPVSLYVYVEDVDTVFRRVVDAGAEAEMEPEDMFWGDRMCAVVDPFGHRWTIATHVEDVDPGEMERRQRKAMEEWGG